MAKPALLAAINAIYDRAPVRAQLSFAHHFKGIFWEQPRDVRGTWTVTFMGKKLFVPLRPETINLDWIFALALVTHDRPVLDTYRAFARSPRRPEVFVDIGASYGMHSLLMAKIGVEVLAFEPNPRCRSYSETIHRINSVEPNTVGCALGDRTGTAELVFPVSETWLGSIVPRVAEASEASGEFEAVPVPVRRLDDIPLREAPTLIKIDVEGAELLVLGGGRETLLKHRPSVIFEANDALSRRQLQDFFADMGWTVHPLPFDPQKPGKPISALERAGGTNFIAIAEPA